MIITSQSANVLFEMEPVAKGRPKSNRSPCMHVNLVHLYICMDILIYCCMAGNVDIFPYILQHISFYHVRTIFGGFHES